MINLDSATGTIDLSPATSVISLDSPLETAMTNYRELVLLVNQNGDNLVNQSGDLLATTVVRSTRTNVITLGE